MTFTNVGAMLAGGIRPESKAALKRAATAGELITFDTTSAMTPSEMIVIEPLGAVTPDAARAADARFILPGERLSVVGPNPYTSRKWYATVELVNGKVKVS